MSPQTPPTPDTTAASALSGLADALEARELRPFADRPGLVLRVRGLHAGALASFPAPLAVGAEDLRASVSVPARGPAIALASFAPEDALRLLARTVGPPRVAGAALAQIRCVGASLGVGLAAAHGREVEGDARVVEETLVTTVLAMHPPPDTRVVTVVAQVEDLPVLLLWLSPEKAP